MINNYIVGDSTLNNKFNNKERYDPQSGLIYMGIVRQEEENEERGTIYKVEIYTDGQQIPITCVPVTRFNSPYNFEEIKLKPWQRGSASPPFLPANSAGSYKYRDGDIVVIGLLNGNMREGVILGSVKHPIRDTKLEKEKLSYYSIYNGLETMIDEKGAYTVTFQGAPLNDKAPPSLGAVEVIKEPQYNPVIAGSFYGFDDTGSFTIDTSNELGTNMIMIKRDPAGGSIMIESGKNIISIAGNPALGEISVATDTLAVEVLDAELKATKSIKLEGLQVSIKGTQLALGNDTIELVDGLIQILDGIGQVTVTSPVGTCTPIMASPQWASSIIPLIVKLNTLKGSL